MQTLSVFDPWIRLKLRLAAYKASNVLLIGLRDQKPLCYCFREKNKNGFWHFFISSEHESLKPQYVISKRAPKGAEISTAYPPNAGQKLTGQVGILPRALLAGSPGHIKGSISVHCTLVSGQGLQQQCQCVWPASPDPSPHCVREWESHFFLFLTGYAASSQEWKDWWSVRASGMLKWHNQEFIVK